MNDIQKALEFIAARRRVLEEELNRLKAAEYALKGLCRDGEPPDPQSDTTGKPKTLGAAIREVLREGGPLETDEVCRRVFVYFPQANEKSLRSLLFIGRKKGQLSRGPDGRWCVADGEKPAEGNLLHSGGGPP